MILDVSKFAIVCIGLTEFKTIMEFINVNGTLIPHAVVFIRGDGACLFRALSYHMYGSDTHAQEVRHDIVKYVCDHWNENFKIMSHDPQGNNYNDAQSYFTSMIDIKSYGGVCELTCAGIIYEFVFEVCFLLLTWSL